ncbi:hypothetical protein BDZ89DRAFT_1045316 [Hymenopellis radicata]|nr:hypothetical protein BDZ89DRAFT_1045316 [Hymenopellis radicata]
MCFFLNIADQYTCEHQVVKKRQLIFCQPYSAQTPLQQNMQTAHGCGTNGGNGAAASSMRQVSCLTEGPTTIIKLQGLIFLGHTPLRRTQMEFHRTISSLMQQLWFDELPCGAQISRAPKNVDCADRSLSGREGRFSRMKVQATPGGSKCYSEQIFKLTTLDGNIDPVIWIGGCKPLSTFCTVTAFGCSPPQNDFLECDILGHYLAQHLEGLQPDQMLNKQP